MGLTWKRLIQRYVVLKINSGEWQAETKIPSEHQLALKFGCSRLTTREALQSLVYSGVLHAQKGSGYVVPAGNRETSLKSFALANYVSKTKVKDLESDSWLLKVFKIDKNQKFYSFEKRYYDHEGLVGIQFTILNKNIVWELDKDAVKQSLTSYLAHNGVAITYSDFDIVVLSDQPMVKKAAQELGWDTKYFPQEIINSYCTDGWVEKTIRVTSPSSFAAHFRKQNYL